jgi:hypothetical protein
LSDFTFRHLGKFIHEDDFDDLCIHGVRAEATLPLDPKPSTLAAPVAKAQDCWKTAQA